MVLRVAAWEAVRVQGGEEEGAAAKHLCQAGPQRPQAGPTVERQAHYAHAEAEAPYRGGMPCRNTHCARPASQLRCVRAEEAHRRARRDGAADPPPPVPLHPAPPSPCSLRTLLHAPYPTHPLQGVQARADHCGVWVVHKAQQRAPAGVLGHGYAPCVAEPSARGGACAA